MRQSVAMRTGASFGRRHAEREALAEAAVGAARATLACDGAAAVRRVRLGDAR